MLQNGVNIKIESPINAKRRGKVVDFMREELSIFVFADRDTQHSMGGGQEHKDTVSFLCQVPLETPDSEATSLVF
jgi:hypothetical protein